jgi:hypothetical protein
MRIIGLDIHRAFAEAVACKDGKHKRLGRVEMRRPLLAAFAATLTKADVVVIEATGNASAAAGVIGPHVKRVVIANPKQVRIIAHAKIKTDTIDGVLAKLYPSGFLRGDPGVTPAGHPSPSDRAVRWFGLCRIAIGARVASARLRPPRLRTCSAPRHRAGAAYCGSAAPPTAE